MSQNISSLTATASAYNSIDLSFSNATSDRIEIQRKEIAGSYETIDKIDGDETSYTDSSVDGSVHYYYRARTISDTEDDWSDEADEWTPPNTPSGLAVSYSGKTATLTWTNGGLAYTYIYPEWKTSAGSSWTTESAITGTLETTTITVTNEATDYDFRVRGYYDSSTLYSAYATEEDQTSGIMAPTSMELSCPSTTSVKIDWTDNSSVETGVEVWMDQALTYTTAADAETYTKESLSESTEYDFKVRAVTATAQSAFTDEESITTGALPDGTPTSVSVTATGQTTATITWTDTATNADRFYILRSTDDSTYTSVSYVADSVETYSDTGLTSNTQYYYKIRPWNSSGWGTASSSDNDTTDIDLDPPSNLIATTLSSTQIKLEWTNNADDVDTYCIERKTTGAYSEIDTVSSGTEEYTNSSLTAGTAYTYRIRCKQDSPETYGDYSAPITKTIEAVGTTAIQRNDVFIAQNNVIYQAYDEPNTTLECYWTSKPTDFSDQDNQAQGRFKTIKRVQLEYVDNYSSTPVSIKISSDGGETWATATVNLGDGDGTSKTAYYYFGPVSGQYFIFRVYSSDADTTFTWTGMIVEYKLRGETFETGALMPSVSIDLGSAIDVDGGEV